METSIEVGANFQRQLRGAAVYFLGENYIFQVLLDCVAGVFEHSCVA